MKATFLLLAGLAVLTASAQAGTATHSRTVTGPQGNTATRTVQTTGQAGSGATRVVTRTGPEGNTATRTAVVTPTAVPRARAVVVNGPQGGVTTGVVRRGPVLTTGRVTGPQGNTRAVVRIHR